MRERQAYRCGRRLTRCGDQENGRGRANTASLRCAATSGSGQRWCRAGLPLFSPKYVIVEAPLSLDKPTRIEFKGVCQFPKYGNARGNLGTFDRPDVAGTQAGPLCHIFLGQLPLVAEPTKICRQNVLQIHSEGIMKAERKF